MMLKRFLDLHDVLDEPDAQPAPSWVVPVIFISIFSVFAGALRQVEFLGDDWEFLLKASLGWQTALEATGDYHYIPVFLTYLRLLILPFGLNPVPMAAAAILLHATNVYLLFRLAKRLHCSLSESLAVALVYGTHYYMFEAVYWITCSSTLLMITFYLLTLNTFIWATNSGASPFRFIVPWCCSALCFFSLESGVSIFALCAIIDILRRYKENPDADFLGQWKPLGGTIARTICFGTVVLAMFAAKQATGGRFTVDQGVNVARVPALVVNYALQSWVPSQKYSAMIGHASATKTSISQYGLTYDSIPLFAALAIIFVLLPTALILWRGSSVHKFGLLWFFLAAGTMSAGTSYIAPRYFAVIGLPGAWLLVTCGRSVLLGLVDRIGRAPGPVFRESLFGAFVAVVVVTGALSNWRMSSIYVDATRAVKSAIESNVLQHAFRHPSHEPMILLNVPDIYPARPDGNHFAYLFRQHEVLPMAVTMRLGPESGVRFEDMVTGRIVGLGDDQNVWVGYPEYGNAETRELIESDRMVLVAELSEGTLDFARVRDDGNLFLDREYGREPLEELEDLDRLVLKIHRMNREEVLKYLEGVEPENRPGVVRAWNSRYPDENPIPGAGGESMDEPTEEGTPLERLIKQIESMSRREVLEYLEGLESENKSGVISVWESRYPDEQPLISEDDALNQLIHDIEQMNREEVLKYLEGLGPEDKAGVISVWNSKYPDEDPILEQ